MQSQTTFIFVLLHFDRVWLKIISALLDKQNVCKIIFIIHPVTKSSNMFLLLRYQVVMDN